VKALLSGKGSIEQLSQKYGVSQETILVTSRSGEAIRLRAAAGALSTGVSLALEGRITA
jgi:hypothetical protein